MCLCSIAHVTITKYIKSWTKEKQEKYVLEQFTAKSSRPGMSLLMPL